MEPAAVIPVIGAALAAIVLLIDLAGSVRMPPLRLPPAARRLAGVGAVVLVLARSAPAAPAVETPVQRLERADRAPTHPRPRSADPERVRLMVEPRPGSGYRVRPGDSLWAIACRALDEPEDASVDSYWRAIYAANRQVIGDDPDLIFPGQILTLPEEG